ncbi:FkbM family methyltransferase [Formosa sp. A9]|uniref:FkbM family methyltransferase n=1 Tax=Formosa sp. A9 TaxID=3442641 RepID=UPI003EC076C7
MKREVLSIYSKLPETLKLRFRRLKFFTFFKNQILGHNDKLYCEYFEINKKYKPYNVSFQFYAPIVVGSRAIKKGIESTLLRHSVELVNRYKTNKEDTIIIDVGANYGFLSMVWANSLALEGKIYSIEANPNVYSAFKESLNVNELKNISLLNNAVGNKNGSVQLFINNTSSNIIHNQSVTDVIEINMITLDTFIKNKNIERCDLIKIDVDGIEYEILQGSKFILQKFKPICIVELNEDFKILQFFSDLDYSVLDMNLKQVNCEKVPKVWPLNIFCVHKDDYHSN